MQERKHRGKNHVIWYSFLRYLLCLSKISIRNRTYLYSHERFVSFYNSPQKKRKKNRKRKNKVEEKHPLTSFKWHSICQNPSKQETRRREKGNEKKKEKIASKVKLPGEETVDNTETRKKFDLQAGILNSQGREKGMEESPPYLRTENPESGSKSRKTAKHRYRAGRTSDIKGREIREERFSRRDWHSRLIHACLIFACSLKRLAGHQTQPSSSSFRGIVASWKLPSAPFPGEFLECVAKRDFRICISLPDEKLLNFRYVLKNFY